MNDVFVKHMVERLRKIIWSVTGCSDSLAELAAGEVADYIERSTVPVTPEAEFEVWQDDAVVAGCSGPRGPSLAEAVHYAVVYQTDDHPCVIQEVIRREIDPDQAHYLIAQDSTQ